MTETEQSDEKIVAVASEVPASTEPTAVPAAAAEGEKPLSKSALKKLAKGKGVSRNCIELCACVCVLRERETRSKLLTRYYCTESKEGETSLGRWKWQEEGSQGAPSHGRICQYNPKGRKERHVCSYGRCLSPQGCRSRLARLVGSVWFLQGRPTVGHGTTC